MIPNASITAWRRVVPWASTAVLPFDYDVDSAGELIIEHVLQHLDGGSGR